LIAFKPRVPKRLEGTVEPTTASPLEGARSPGESTPRRLASKYDVITELGHGGMADVYLAMARGPAGFTKLIVIKQIREDIAQDARFLRMLLDEARLAAQLNHPNIVQTNEVGVDDAGRFFVAMEHLEGQSLAKLLQRLQARERELPMRAALRVAIDALAGLHYAHELADFTGKPLEVVHCDVSPHNLFVTYAGQVKVLDFGLAKAKSSATQALSGEIRGKLYYMAPEQACAQPVDRRADIFAMGVVLWEMLTGHQLWRGHTDIAVACSLRFGEIPLLSALAPELPAPVLAVCQKALAFLPEERFATAFEFQVALERIRNELPAEAAAEELGPLVAEVFSDERSAIRKLVGSHMDQLGSREAAAAPPGALGQLTMAKGPRSARPHPHPWLLPAAAIAVVASVATMLTTRDSPPPPTAQTPARSEPSAASVPSAESKPSAASNPSAASDSPAAFVRVDIRVHAEAARIYWDDRLLFGNPFHGQFERDAVVHRVRAEALGYKSQEARVTLDRDLVFEVTLEREAPSTTPSADASPRHTSRTKPRVRVEPQPGAPEAGPPKRPVFEDPWGDQ
jgi:eukaryotic-like serine/threonine-protein kinase